MKKSKDFGQNHSSVLTTTPCMFYSVQSQSKPNTKQDLILKISFEHNLFHSFHALKQVYLQIHPLMLKEAPDLIEKFSVELQYLFPQEIQAERTLEEIAAGSSERRLSRESEQLFRVIWGMVSLVNEFAERINQPLHIMFHQISEADRVSLQYIKYLSQTQSSDLHLWVHIGDIPQSWGEETRMIRTNLINSLTEFLALSETKIEDSMYDWIAFDESLIGDADVAINFYQNGSFSSWESCREILHNYIMLGNYEAGMCLAEKGLTLEGTAEQISFYWKSKGLAYAFHGDFAKAVSCYEKILLHSQDTAMRTSTYMFLALLSSKRLSAEKQAQLLLEEGFHLAEDLHGVQKDLEEGWLYNVKALSSFREKNFQEAYTSSNKALKRVKPHQGSDALHLKINIISNISVLFESMKLAEKSLSTWEIFDQFMEKGSNAAFAKVYLFRLGALQVKCGMREEGVKHIEEAYQEALDINDVFHICFITNELAYYAWEIGNKDEAVHWLTTSYQAATSFWDTSLADKRQKQIDSIRTGYPPDELINEKRLTKIGHPFYPIHL
jgi:tetratricopeptide (TPR) repeat protein